MAIAAPIARSIQRVLAPLNSGKVIAARKASIEMDVDGAQKVLCMEFQEMKQRHGSMEDRKVFLEVKLENMRITNREVLPLTDVSYEADDTSTTPKLGPGALKSQAAVKGKIK